MVVRRAAVRAVRQSRGQWVGRPGWGRGGHLAALGGAPDLGRVLPAHLFPRDEMGACNDIPRSCCDASQQAASSKQQAASTKQQQELESRDVQSSTEVVTSPPNSRTSTHSCQRESNCQSHAPRPRACHCLPNPRGDCHLASHCRYEAIVDTLLHELTHNVPPPQDSNARSGHLPRR